MESYVWTRADVDAVLVQILGPVAGFLAFLAVLLLGFALLRDIGR